MIERVVLLDNIPAGTERNGGHVRFGPDDLLYVTTGDAGEPSRAQDLASLAGKILRLARDGTTPRGNPFGSPILSAGHRNPQGIDWHPISKELWSDEHGSPGNDEINVIEAGGNYGWPRLEGRHELPGMQPPIALLDGAAGPAGGSFYRGERIAPFTNDFFVPMSQGHGLLRIHADPRAPRRVAGSEPVVDGRFGRLRGVVSGPDGFLYFVTNNGRNGSGDRILRIVPR